MENKGNLCYFTTCADKVTTTCSRDGNFDEFGFPINECFYKSTCLIIKGLNSKEYRDLRHSRN